MIERPRRLRRTAALRRLVAETRLHPAQLILPLFVREDLVEPAPIGSMPGVVAHTRQSLQEAIGAAQQAGVGAVMLFGVPAHRDSGAAALRSDNILARSIRWAKQAAPDMPVIADLCLDEFTDHGHCGVLDASGEVDNDATLSMYVLMAGVLVDAGADVLGLSGMMDGQVGAVRAALDDIGRTDTVLLAYAAKYSSAFYGPFREAVASTLVGDRRSYQQDPANGREAGREVRLDVAQGADIVMVKPALGYLDVVAATRAAVDIPVAAYVVSGEYAMVEAAAAAGYIDRKAAMIEILTSVHRAGAGLIATYWATEVALMLRGGNPEGAR